MMTPDKMGYQRCVEAHARMFGAGCESPSVEEMQPCPFCQDEPCNDRAVDDGILCPMCGGDGFVVSPAGEEG